MCLASCCMLNSLKTLSVLFLNGSNSFTAAHKTGLGFGESFFKEEAIALIAVNDYRFFLLQSLNLLLLLVHRDFMGLGYADLGLRVPGGLLQNIDAFLGLDHGRTVGFLRLLHARQQLAPVFCKDTCEYHSHTSVTFWLLTNLANNCRITLRT